MKLENLTCTAADETILACLPPLPFFVRERIELWAESAAFDLDEFRDKVENATREKTRGELEPYESAWQSLVNAWQETLADGRWPCAEPHDSNLANAIHEDMQRGADAIEALASVREALADPACTLEDVRAILANMEE